MIVIIELVGTLKTLANAEKYSVELEEKTTISMLVRKLKTEFFADKKFADESNLLIILNGKEVSVLNGIQTELKNEDTVTFIPVAHGG